MTAAERHDDPGRRLARTEELLRAAREELAQSKRERDALLRSLTEVQELHQIASESLRSDLALAREIQSSLLPDCAPGWSGLELRCDSRPAHEIGGDFYTYRASSNPKVLLNKYLVAVGDASGKGVSAALLMAATLARFDSSSGDRLGPAERLAQLDRLVQPFTRQRRQSCALCCVEVVGVNTVRPVLRAANAGCVPPYVKRADGPVEAVEVGGPPLGTGLGAKSGYREVSVPLAKGDMVVITSDGVVEARGAGDELFGFERLEAAIAGGPTTGADEMIAHLHGEVASFLDGREPHDDVTIVVLRLEA